MKKVISSAKTFKKFVKKVQFMDFAINAFTELLESLRARNSNGEEVEEISHFSESCSFKQWGSVKITEPGVSFQSIREAIRDCLDQLTKMVNFMMQSKTGLQGGQFNAIKVTLRTLGGYSDKKTKEVQETRMASVSRKLTDELFKNLNKSAGDYLEYALKKTKNTTPEDSDRPKTFESIAEELKNEECDHGKKKIKICQLIQHLYQKYEAQITPLFTVSEELNRAVTLYIARESMGKTASKTPPNPELLLQAILLFTPEEEVFSEVFLDKGAKDMVYFLDKVPAEEIIGFYTESVIERLIESLETWTAKQENLQKAEYPQLKAYLKNLYTELVKDHKNKCDQGAQAEETMLTKVLMKSANVNTAIVVMTLADERGKYLLNDKEAKDLLNAILDKEIKLQKTETTPFRSNTTAMRVLRQYILRLSGKFFPTIVTKLVEKLKAIRLAQADNPTQEDDEIKLLTMSTNLSECLSFGEPPIELTQFLAELKAKIANEFPDTSTAILQNFIVLRILGADIMTALPHDDPHCEALQKLTLTLQKAIKGGKESDKRLSGLDRFLNKLYKY